VDEWLLEIISTAGYVGLALLMLLENVFPVIPSELILPFAGYLVAREELAMSSVILSATLGSSAGATVWFVLGRRWGTRGVHRFAAEHGRWLLLDVEDVSRAEQWFARHTKSATFFGRLLPGVRALISVPAGVAGMRTPLFLAFTVAGTATWTVALTVAGYLLADAYDRARDVIGPIGTIVFALFVGTLVFRHIRRRRLAACR
jgi:membrane protein DedA with SNARE-associated domain